MKGDPKGYPGEKHDASKVIKMECVDIKNKQFPHISKPRFWIVNFFPVAMHSAWQDNIRAALGERTEAQLPEKVIIGFPDWDPQLVVYEYRLFAILRTYYEGITGKTFKMTFFYWVVFRTLALFIGSLIISLPVILLAFTYSDNRWLFIIRVYSVTG